MAAKNINDMTLEELNAQMAQMQSVISNKMRLENIEAIKDALSDAPAQLVSDILAIIKGEKSIHTPSKKNKKVKVLTLKDGKVFYGTQEIVQLKKDKAGALRIVKTGKGAPPLVADQSEEIKSVLEKLPVVE